MVVVSGLSTVPRNSYYSLLSLSTAIATADHGTGHLRGLPFHRTASILCGKTLHSSITGPTVKINCKDFDYKTTVIFRKMKSISTGMVSESAVSMRTLIKRFTPSLYQSFNNLTENSVLKANFIKTLVFIYSKKDATHTQDGTAGLLAAGQSSGSAASSSHKLRPLPPL